MAEVAEKPAASEEERGIWGRVSRHPFWSALIAGVILLVVGMVLQPAAKRLYHFVRPVHHPLVVAGWGPLRPVYWCKAPTSCDGADHVVFNSYINAPNYGDERAFVDAKPASDVGPGGYHDALTVSPGETVLVRIYVDNSAWAARVPPGGGAARGTRARVEVPLNGSRVHYLYAYISAANAQPKIVWDGTTLVSKQNTKLRYVFGSGHWWQSNIPVPDSLMEDGTLIGTRALNGEFGDNFTDGGFLTFKVRVSRA